MFSWASCTAQQTSAAEIPHDSHRGDYRAVLERPWFDLKPLSHAHNELAACASRRPATFKHEKAAEEVN